jgi:hypothetical protein
MWPLPGLYFVEMMALSLVSALAFVRGGPRGQFMIWAAAGILSAFSILGALSVGFFYLPVAVLFGVAAILSDVRNNQHIAAHLGVYVMAALAQAVVMFTVIRLLHPTAVF